MVNKHAKVLYQNSKRNEKTDLGERRQRSQKRRTRIIGIAAFGLLLMTCGAPSGKAEETQSAETKEEPKEWPEEHVPHTPFDRHIERMV